MSKKISVIIVDDHMVVRKGLMHVLVNASDFEVIAEADSGEEAIYLCKKLNPDMVIMDIKMDGIDGIEATKLIKKHYPLICVAALSSFVTTDLVRNMFQAGVDGYLLKDMSAIDLTQSLLSIMNGEQLFPVALSSDTDVKKTLTPSNEFNIEMSKQQLLVLHFMTKGLTNPEIAVQMNISISTARYHVSAILRKLEVSNRVEAVSFAIQHNLLEIS